MKVDQNFIQAIDLPASIRKNIHQIIIHQIYKIILIKINYLFVPSIEVNV